ncbi:unnamed protein product [Bathycoccus prasinos]
MGGCCTCVGRKGLWYVWAFNALIASIFSIIAVSHGAVFDKIIVNNKSANAMLDGAIACISCSVFLNIAYLVITALILLRKTIALNGAGAAFGFMIALSLMMLDSSSNRFTRGLRSSSHQLPGNTGRPRTTLTHEALVAFAYLSGSTYVVLTFVLFCGSGGLQKSMMDDGPRSIELEHNNSSNNNNTNNA